MQPHQEKPKQTEFKCIHVLVQFVRKRCAVKNDFEQDSPQLLSLSPSPAGTQQPPAPQTRPSPRKKPLPLTSAVACLQ